jgi:cell envelope opacity-associated protein A
MKNLILDIKYYLLFLIIVLFIFFLYLKKNENFTEKYSPEIISDESFREKVELINPVSSERYSGALLKKIKVQKNDTLIKLLEKNGVSKIYIKAIIKTKGSEKLSEIKTGDFI